jgi:hypothetical protein
MDTIFPEKVKKIRDGRMNRPRGISENNFIDTPRKGTLKGY